MSEGTVMTSRPSSQIDPAKVEWSELDRPVPEWYLDAKFGIMIHWGAYSVPAWAEPTGELGTISSEVWFPHNPYAEWYWNTIRFDDSPARRFHRHAYADAPYDNFLDAWVVDAFEPDQWMELFARAGARYVVPTSKHHDGITLWDAPGTGTRNTVRRGPKRDLLSEIELATRNAGLRFGVYYSGGLDWSISSLPPIDAIPGLDIFGPARTIRPRDAAYAAYAYLHVRDLIDRYKPDLIWRRYRVAGRRQAWRLARPLRALPALLRHDSRGRGQRPVG